MQDRDQALLQRRLQIDEQVAATDQVHARERRIGQHVVPGEHAQVADGLGDAVVSVHLDEEAAQSLARDVQQSFLGIEAGAGAFDACRIQIGAKHLQGCGALRRSDRFRKQHGQRVGFLARRAGGHPDAHWIVARALSEQRRKDLRLERLEHLGIAEEAGDVDQDVLVQRRDFGWILADPPRVVLEVGRLLQDHPPAHAPQQGVRLVLREVGSRGAAQDAQDRCQARLARFRFEFILKRFLPIEVCCKARVQADVRNFCRDGFGGKHEVDAARGDGALRHALLLGRLVLREGDSIQRLDRFQPERSVGGGAREHDADGHVALSRRERAEELIDRMMFSVHVARG